MAIRMTAGVYRGHVRGEGGVDRWPGNRFPGDEYWLKIEIVPGVWSCSNRGQKEKKRAIGACLLRRDGV